LEFSFDRSNESAQARNSQPKAETSAQTAQATHQNAAHDDGIDTTTIANERLRKAIERNRARQAERNKNHPPRPDEQASLFDKPQAEEKERNVPPQRPRAQERSNTVVTRRSVARPDEAEFTPVKRTPRKVSTQVSYATSGSRKKSKPIDPSLVGYFVKGCWLFCGIMVLRLIFAHGGVTDYYSNSSVHNDRLLELDRIKKENMQLVREIERMQTDTAFQKKLVRDNLGFIASDEFLVLFPKESKVQ
jgi:cell division protein FtsB